ncbi:xaa-Pro aminopeptidase 1-like [Styela clava]
MMALRLILLVYVSILAVCCVPISPSHMDSLIWDETTSHHHVKRSLRENDNSIRDCSDPNNIYLPPTTVITSARLSSLRQEMRSSEYNAYMVPSEDEHLSEYIAPKYKRREWISGFSGSQGIAVITETDAALWADGRYYIQAEREMDCNWKLMRTGDPETPTIQAWLEQSLENSSIVAANPFVLSIGRWQFYEREFSKAGIAFNQSIPDLIDRIWTDRPGPMGSEIIVFPIAYAGKEWKEKVTDARKAMEEKSADYLLLTLLDEIAWLFNLRGTDIPYTPVFESYALVGRTDVRLYVNLSLAETSEVTAHLQPTGCGNLCVQLIDYAQARNDLLSLPTQSTVWMSTASTTYGMFSAVPEDKQIQDESPIKVPKTIKNEIERQGMKQAQIFDAIALCEYFIWLEENVPKGVVDEITGANKIANLRRSQQANKGLSFGAISASGPNAALPHYSTSGDTNRNLTLDEIYLLDSGGHYFEGTTDITRTLHFGTPSDFQKETFTRVLMGVIDIETAVFPEYLDGNDIGILARQPLYDVGLDFNHGSGHGIGHYLGIHEYPPGIGTSGAAGYPLQVGMFTSIEPGYYHDGEFGIRHENNIMVTYANTEYQFGEYQYLTFESATLVPFQAKMIDSDLLSDKQLNYLNDYHAKVLEKVGAEAKKQGKQEVYDWLTKATKPISRNGAGKLTSSLYYTSSFFVLLMLKYLSY